MRDRGVHFGWKGDHFFGWDHEVLEWIDGRSFWTNLFDADASASFLSHGGLVVNEGRFLCELLVMPFSVGHWVFLTEVM